MKLLLWLVLLIMGAISPVLAIDLRLMTGDKQGTYYQFGQEIANQTGKVGINLQVLPSDGSWANIVALFNNDTEFAIFQLDAYLKAARNFYQNTSQQIQDEIKVVMPLYHEEIHVIKAKERELDFAGEETFMVSCGPESSGSCITADVIADFYGKNFTYVNESYEQSLIDLKAGKLDLVIITAGKPYKLLTEQTGLDLVALPRTKKAAEIYLYTTITPDDYTWLERSVETYGVRSVLATMIQEQEGLANDLVGTVHFTILINEERLKKHGHPKWHEVMFKGFNEKIAHKAVLESIGACNLLRGYGYNCQSLAKDD
jgi:TRAP transporter TAXI family solute receptor